jgi:uncharacterized membrane protein
MGHITLYLQAFITYVVVGIGYQLAVGFGFFTHFIEGAQFDFYVEPTSTGLMLVFFTLIAIANVHLCILPAIAAKSVSMALKNGAFLGATAYATLGLTNGWSIGDFPLAFALTMTLESLFFSLITSGLTTWSRLRKHTHTESS